MKRFLKYVICFFLPIAAVAFCLEMIARSAPNPYKYKYEWMQAHAKEVNTLVFGSSHTFEGIRPEYLSGTAFNLANYAQGFQHDLYLLKYWADKYEELKVVIYPISYFTWPYGGVTEDNESYRCRYYKIYMDCDMYSSFSKYNFELSDLYATRHKLLRMLRSDDSEGSMCSEYGSDNTNLLSEKNLKAWNDTAVAAKRAQRHTRNDSRQVKENYEIMTEIAAFCRDHSVHLVIVTTPCWKTYIQHLDPKQLNEMYQLISRLQSEYQLIYLDYFNDNRFDADDFYNCDHLSDKGAIKFTKILNNDIQSQLSLKGEKNHQEKDPVVGK